MLASWREACWDPSTSGKGIRAGKGTGRILTAHLTGGVSDFPSHPNMSYFRIIHPSREMQIKRTVEYHFTLVIIAIIIKSTNNKCWRRCGEKGTLLHSWWECKLVQLLWRTVWRFLKKLQIELPYDPGIPLLGIHTKETRIERDTCTPMFIAALFIIARTWKQPRCPPADEWIRKLWCMYTMEYYSATKKNTFESILMRWMKLKPIIRVK